MNSVKKCGPENVYCKRGNNISYSVLSQHYRRVLVQNLVSRTSMPYNTEHYRINVTRI